MRHLEGTRSLLIAHPWRHMEPKGAQCPSDHVVYTGTEGLPFGRGERGHSTEVFEYGQSSLGSSV